MNQLRKLSNSISDLFRSSTSIAQIGDSESSQSPEDCGSPTIAERFPLHNAAVFGKSVEAEYLLFVRNYDPNEEDDRGRIPLHYSVQSESVYVSKLLIRCGAYVDALDYVEATPAHFVAKENQIDNALLLLSNGADFCMRDKLGKTAVDVAAEAGHTSLIRFLIDHWCVAKLIETYDAVERVPNSPLHLAARYGHVEVVNMLLTDAKFPIDLLTPQGSALHEAIKHEQLQVIRLLLHLHCETNTTDQRGFTVWDYVTKYTHVNSKLAPLITELLDANQKRFYCIAVRDFNQKTLDPIHRYRENSPRGGELALKSGDIVWILEDPSTAHEKFFWRGIVFSPNGNSCCGSFPRRIVRSIQLAPLIFGDMGFELYRKASGGKPRKAKKASVPLVPDLMILDSSLNSSTTTGYHTDSGSNASDRHSYYTNSSTPYSGGSPTLSRTESCMDNATVASFPDDDYSCTETIPMASMPLSHSMLHATSFGSLAPSNCGGYLTDSQMSGGYATCEVAPSSSSRFSQLSSSSCTIDQMRPPSACTSFSFNGSTSSKLSGGGFQSIVKQQGQRRKRHRVAELFSKGIAEEQIMAEWLRSLGFDHYLPLFVNQGYDLSAISRMTPQDLIALGITQPDDRRQLIHDIHEWNISDRYPSYIPRSNGIRDFLTTIGLAQYVELLQAQKISTIGDLEDLTWEDFEDLGIKKLGHMKILGVAIKKLKMTREVRQKGTDGSMTVPNPSSASLARNQDCIVSTNSYGTLKRPGFAAPDVPARSKPIVSVPPNPYSAQVSAKDTVINNSDNGLCNFDDKPRKPTTLNLMLSNQILSKVDDIENDSVLSSSFTDDFPPSPAPLSHIPTLYSMQTPGRDLDADIDDYEFYKRYTFDVIDGTSGLPQRYGHSCNNSRGVNNRLNDLGRMLLDLTDELDAKLTTCDSTAV